jgi:dipeptidyl aminopeptidase/acylaminoacyl peptidase
MLQAVSTRRSLLLFLAAAAASLVAQPGAKRPITHNDYDLWRSISSQRLSANGRFLAYALFPQEGDGELVLRNLDTGAERREPIGARPQRTESPEAEPSEPGPARAAPGGPSITISFTSDDRRLVFTTFPTKADTDKARRERKRPEEMPKGGLVILDVNGGDPIRIAQVRSFQLAENNGQWLAYLKEPEPSRQASGEEKKSATQNEDQGRFSRGGAQAGGPGGTRYGSPLVLRDLNSNNERQFADVTEYSLAKDGELVLYAVSSRKEETNGVYAAPTAGGETKPVVAGKGKSQRLTWNEKQTQLAFLSSRDDAASLNPKYKLYLWDRGGDGAQSIVAGDSAGIPQDWVISERGALNFSKDGERLFFATAPNRAPRTAQENEPTEDKVVADLWHWKDEIVQPMQKVRAEQERNRSFRAVVHLRDKRVIQLADRSMSDLNLTEDAAAGIGVDDREYRPLAEYDTRYSDAYYVDVSTGARTLLMRKIRGNLNPSPDGKFAVTFNGRDWLSVALPSGKTTNLTSGIGVAFHNEDYDSPGVSPPYGLAGWTKDSKSALLYDRHDIWQVSPDGASARNLTDGVGRKQKLQYRNVRFGQERSPFERGAASIDTAKPLLLSAEHLETRDSGFWQDSVGADTPPRQLVMAARNYSTPVKARNADVLLLSATRFDEPGDLLVTDPEFKNVRKVSNANPQKDQLLWGSAEMVHFENLDGVRLSAILHKPENFDPSKKYPMLVYIYERLSQSLHSFRPPAPGTSINVAYYVSNGYLVLQPDIAYTIGYPGQSALKCVLPAIQAVVNKGYVNENAIGIQGHSWGGYQIAYMITQTNRFRAAAAGAPVANMISAYDGIRWGSGLPRQFQYERTQSRIGGSIWEYPVRFVENSPIFHANRAATPLLMVHNDNDDAVPWYQGIEYFLALRRLNKEVYLFNYNGEPHGLRRRVNQKDYTMRMQQFFDHYLKGSPKPEWMARGIPYLEREQEKEKWRKPAHSGPSSGAP